jgi:hypothetical protein
VAKAKAPKSSSGSKISFGKKAVKGSAKKKFGPNEQRPKKYRGQGK